MERTLLLIKPDAVQRCLVGDIIGRCERKGLKVVGLKMLRITEELASQHYAEHEGRAFYGRLIEFVMSSPTIAVALEGENAIARTRKLIGATLPEDADMGTIRGDLSAHRTLNLVHASDAPVSALRELALFFASEELLAYERCDEAWLGIGG